MQVSVSVDGVEHSISPTAGDLVRLERHYQISAAQLDDEHVTVEHVLFIAWNALRRTKAIPDELDFESFIDLADVPRGGSLVPPAPLPQT